MNQTATIPKVSVCVITYNQEPYIRQCLQSIVDQKPDFDFEVIVGEDCSTDGTRDIVREFAERYPKIVKPIYQEKNIGGGCHNYLTVHNAAKGEYVAHVDGDDWCMANKLSSQSLFLDENSDCVAVVHKMAKYGLSGDLLGDLLPNKFSHAKYDLIKLVTTHGEFAHSSLMYRRSAFFPNNYLKEIRFIDLLIYVHLASQGKIGVIEKVLGKYTHGLGISFSTNLYEYVENALEYAMQVGLSEKIYHFALARQYLLLAKKAIMDGDNILFEKLISLSVAKKYLSIQQIIFYFFRKNIGFLKLLLALRRTMRNETIFH